MDEPIPQTRAPDPAPVPVDTEGRPAYSSRAEAGRDMGALARDARRLAQLYTDLLRARVRRIVLGVTLAVLATLFGLVLLVVSAVYVARGTMLGFTALSGSSWAGHLLTGLLFAGLVVGGLIVLDRMQRARRLKRLRARYGPAGPASGPPGPGTE